MSLNIGAVGNAIRFAAGAVGVLRVVGWPAMLVVLGLPIAGFLLGAGADELFRRNEKQTERGSRMAEIAMLLNAIVPGGGGGTDSPVSSSSLSLIMICGESGTAPGKKQKRYSHQQYYPGSAR